jgi:hypothetical protein
LNEQTLQYRSILKDAWKRLLLDYQNGNLNIRKEKDLEKGLAEICKSLMRNSEIPILLGRQETYL